MSSATPALILWLLAVAPLSAAVTFDWALVGNAGNAPDPETGFGAIAYDYRISKTEVTNAQYAEFLNNIDPTGVDVFELFDLQMASSAAGGIGNNGGVDHAHYFARAGREHNPVTFVSWYDSARFVNWLHNGSGTGDTETGVYTLQGGTPEPLDGINIARNAGARFWLPNQDEWYKAAYHDASAGTAGSYFDYATGSNIKPISDAPGDNPAGANYFNDDGLTNGFNDGYAATGTTSFLPNPLTDVGAYYDAHSPYGTFDQTGNIAEWTETPFSFSPPFRVTPGGAWFGSQATLTAGMPNIGDPAGASSILGFRVATVPEPTAALLFSVAFCLGHRRPR